MKKWEKKERKDAYDFGGKRTPGSGGKWYSKGDIKTPTYLIEDKTTDHLSYGLDSRTWRKIYNEAILSQRIPLLSLKFNKDGSELIILDKHDFLALTKTDENLLV